MTKWRYFAGRTFPSVVRELGLPAARTVHDPTVTRCTLHGTALGPTARMCPTCFETAWAEVGRRYANVEQGRTGKPARHKPTEVDRPPLQTFPGSKREPIPGPLPLFDEKTNRKENTMQHEPKPTGTTAELVPVNGELVETDERPALPATLFGSDPELAVARIVKIADELARTIRTQKLTASISGKEHVLVEGWTLLGTLLGVFPVLVWTRKFEDGWEARVEARTLDGRVVGAAESECLRSERRWAKADDYAVRSMAATRATSKALRQPLGFVMSLAGFEATPVEEFPAVDESPASHGSIPETDKPTAAQTEHIQSLIRELDQLAPDTDWRARARELAGGPWNLVTRTVADQVIDTLQEEASVA